MGAHGESGSGARRGRPRAPKAAATLADVARLAGVSPITASRAINTPNQVSAAKLEAVRAAVEHLGYVPNVAAGSLHTRRSRLVAAIVPTIATSMFAETVEAFSDRLRAAGYEVLLGLSGFDAAIDREEELVATVLGRKPDAVLLTGIEHSQRARSLLMRTGIPVIETWDLTPTPIDMAIGFSHEEVGRAVARHLLAGDRRRFAVIAAQDLRAAKRRDGFVREIEASGRAMVRAVDVPAPGTVRAGRQAMRGFIEAGVVPDAIFCSSDPIADGVLTEAVHAGFAVPRDLALVGFGDFGFAAEREPSLSTVRIDRRRLGAMAAERILAELAGGEAADRVSDIGFELVGRASS